MELLAPAGSMEALCAAVQNGADAVYLGGSRFHARKFANNFDEEQLSDALDYCHMRGVAVHITLNTLLLDKELPEAFEYAKRLYTLGADALIVQDLGLARMLRQELSDFPLHCSTQMGIHDLEGVELCRSLGYSRVVLAREVPLREISYIHRRSSMPLEAFAHGAMCVSFSGGCLLSSMAGERSGNRGTCAQPCRKQYQWKGRTGAFLSMADLCMLKRLSELEQAGVSSLKIEGRMKRPEYVALVTRAYRTALDGADAAQLEKEVSALQRLFDRGSFHFGYYDGQHAVRTGAAREMEADPAVLQQARETYVSETRKSPLHMELMAHLDRPAKLAVSALGHSAEITGELVTLAQKPQDYSRWQQQLCKLGDTPFFADKIQLNADPKAFLSISSLNQLRRAGVSALQKSVCARRSISADQPRQACDSSAAMPEKTPLISASVRSLEQALAAFSAGAQEVLLAPIAFDVFDYPALFAAKPEGCKLLLALPPVLLSHEVRDAMSKQLERWPWDGAQANALGQIQLIQGEKTRVAGAPLNACNRETGTMLLELGFSRLCLSPELTRPQLRDIAAIHPCSLQVYGRVPVMRLLHCPQRVNGGCGHCEGSTGLLTDEGNRAFPMANQRLGRDCIVHLLNCDVLDLMGCASALPHLQAWELLFWQESPEQVAQVVQNACQAASGASYRPLPGSTRGHWNRAIE